MERALWNNAVTSRDEQRRQKRLAVLGTGARLFNERGFDRTTLDDIAGALNVSKRTLYYYIGSKEEILFECSRLGLEFMQDVLARCRDESLPPIDRIGLLLRGYAALLADDMGACLVLSKDIPLSEPNRDVLREGRRSLDRLLRDLIQAGIDDASIAPNDPKLTAAAIFGAFNWIPHWNRNDNPVSHDALADRYIDLFIEGLRRR
ncbi:TetR/AcrR family transcriptional regulator [Nitratireductor sp. XY-223]|uniref:TetR/AcrR family transcriptional regulator n=1 Tax=Nitratireductor sp. XY-223 TaxID=2561926 RepID=UPI00145BB6DD|nr:TetR/AcrR family transcriptional regulator [Nitratireductor sp. XY-223]